jgi:hypothetical protein
LNDQHLFACLVESIKLGFAEEGPDGFFRISGVDSHILSCRGDEGEKQGRGQVRKRERVGDGN